jgi:uncharacterized protein (DUF1697 family)
VRGAMTTWILLLRGINVGGKNRLPMSELRHHLQSLKLEHVKTYIQTGNAIFQASKKTAATLPAQLASIIEQHHGFSPRVFLLSKEQLEKAIASNPFPEAEAAPKTLHLFFLASTPVAPDVESLTEVTLPSERFHLADDVFYLHAPEGIGRSKLAARIGRCLGVGLTARNWRTVRKLWEMASAR